MRKKTSSSRLCLLVMVFIASGWVSTGMAFAQDKHKTEIVAQVGHSNEIASVAFSRDGKLVVSGGYDHTVKLWDAATGVLLRDFLGHSSAVLSVAFSPDGTHVLTGSLDMTMRLWESATGRLVRSMVHPGPYGLVNSVAYSSDGRHIASGSIDAKVRIWNPATGTILRTLVGHASNVLAVKFSPDGTSLVSSSSDKTIRLWNVGSGQLLRTLSGHSGSISSVAFAPDGSKLVSGSADGLIKLWDARSGRLLTTIDGHVGPTPVKGSMDEKLRAIRSVAYSPDGSTAAAGQLDAIKVWDLASGKLVRRFDEPDRGLALAFSPDSKLLLSGGGKLKLRDTTSGELKRTLEGTSQPHAVAVFSLDESQVLSAHRDARLKLWDARAGRVIREFEGEHGAHTIVLSPDGRRVASVGSDNTTLLWDFASGRVIRTLSGHGTGSAFTGFSTIAFSADGLRVVSGGYDKTAKLWDATNGQLIRTFDGHAAGERFFDSAPAALSPDGSRILVVAFKSLRVYDAASGKLLRTLTGHTDRINAVTFSADGTRMLTGSDDQTVKLWNAATWSLLRTLQGHSSSIRTLEFSRDGARILTASRDGTLKSWDAATGQLLRSFTGHTAGISSGAFSRDGSRVLSGSNDGTIAIWGVNTARPLASFAAGRSKSWLAITPDGFFSASARNPDMLAIVRGIEATTIEQVHQSLFNPDLVRESLAGDPSGEVERAGKLVNLESVIDSGPPPAVAITSPLSGSQSSQELVEVEARITDHGKGIGRIEWRVNGITAVVAANPVGKGPDYTLTQALALDAGDNTIELVAYNSSNLLASLTARTMITFTGPGDDVKPKLHVLAIGINAYIDQGWTPPGRDPTRFAPLKLAANDATTFAASIKRAAAGLYDEARITYVLDNEATRTNLDMTIKRLAREVHPRDTFIFFAAAHGTSESGRFYLIPQDYQGGPDALTRSAIGQDLLQDWFTNQVKAKKTVILLDTCESGALVGGHTQSRVGTAASEAAVGRLHEAIGRPILTAAASGKPAWEGYEGHGVFTWALIDALRNGDANGNGSIELSELVAHVQDRVTQISPQPLEAWRSAVALPRSGTAVQSTQSARFGSRGEDFVLARRLH